MLGALGALGFCQPDGTFISSRDRERFMTHWATKVLGDPTVFVQTVTVDGEPAGSVVAW